jgi:hypothetical protein
MHASDLLILLCFSFYMHKNDGILMYHFSFEGKMKSWFIVIDLFCMNFDHYTFFNFGLIVFT